MVIAYIIAGILIVWFTAFLVLFYKLLKVFNVIANIELDRHHNELRDDYAKMSVYLAEGYDPEKLGNPNKTEEEKNPKLIVACQTMFDSMEQSGFNSPKDGYEHIVTAKYRELKSKNEI